MLLTIAGGILVALAVPAMLRTLGRLLLLLAVLAAVGHLVSG
jgi:hypothetical protein